MIRNLSIPDHAALKFLFERQCVMQPRSLMFALSAVLMCAQNGTAQETDQNDPDKKFFADIGYSRLGTDILQIQEDYEFSPEFGAVDAQFGYRLTEHWSLEGEAIVGVENEKDYLSGSDGTYSNTRQNTYDLDYLIGAYVRGDIPVTSKLTAFARAGLASVEVDVSSNLTSTNLETEEVMNVSSDFTRSDTGIALGVGLTYDFTDKLYLRSDYARYDFEFYDLDSVSLGVGIRF